MSTLLRCLILILYLCLSSIAQSQLQKIYLHPKAAGSEKQSKFVDSIRFIPLEVREGAETTQYSNVEVTRQYFLIRDYTAKAVLLYGKDGRFIRKISYKKLGEGFYPLYDEGRNQLTFFGSNPNYTLTPRDRIKVKLDWSNPKNKKYYKKYKIDLNDTTFTIQKDIPQQNDILRANHYYDDVYSMAMISTSDLYKDSLDYELKLYKGNQLVKGFFPYNCVNEPKFLYKEETVALNKTDVDDTYYLTRPYCDTVYKMVKDQLTPAYQIVLPLENSLPSYFFDKPFKSKTERENFERNNAWMLHQVYSFYETPRFIYFLIGYLSNYEMYMYQKQTQTTWKAKNIKADSSQYNLSLLGDFSLTNKMGKFYKTQKAGDLLNFFEKNKNAPVPPELENFIKNKPPATSPVIIEFTLKN